ncbi:hypothetical protein B0T14DRAFT_570839 [Immersiella caudata]|uniref:NACHT domain-containing protein n=1 Tax=Immersiella caudata TaxID=314043 RepID=A0AA39U273_9PEZI|nr:hypothetical protein B0T14DRAFT_570839 [Immersiella caudata]
MHIVTEIKVQQKSASPWGRVRAAVKLVLKKGQIEQIEDQISKCNGAVLTELCNISAIYHNIHHDNLVNFRSESRRLGLEQSTRLESIETMLKKLSKLPRVSSTERIPVAQKLSEIEHMMARVNLSEHDLANQLRIMRTLTFETRTVRHDAIPLAHKRTFQWVFAPGPNTPCSDSTKTVDAESVGLLEWLAQGDSTFWVSGKPGSGKSTFMKFLADHDATKKALAAWAHPLPVFVGSHYFWISGTTMQKSQEGLLRSLLYGIFSRCPDLMSVACPARWQTKEDTPWTVTEMRFVIDTLSAQDQLPCKFCFFIDGLDEFDGEHLEFCDSLLSMTRSPNDEGRKLYIHDLTKHDVFEYAQDRLQQHPRWKQMRSKTGQTNALINAISDKAQGVFLWVFLVTKLLREGLTNYDTFRELQKRLDTFPSDLEPFFMQIIKSVPDFYREKMAEALKIALADPEPLEALIYSFHDMEDFDLPTADTFNSRREHVAKRLNGRCRGLLEMNPMGQIGFLHRTVADFLRTRDMSTFLNENTTPNFAPNMEVLQHYASLIRAAAYDDRVELSHCVGKALQYASRAEFEKPVSMPALDAAIDTLEYVVSNQWPNRSSVAGMEEENSGVLAFRSRVFAQPLTGYLMRKLARGSSYLLDFRSPGALALLRGPCYMAGGWSPEVVKLVDQVLEHGKGPNQPIAGTGYTVWSSFLAELMPVHDGDTLRVSVGPRFCSALQLDLLSLFLRHGAAPNVPLYDAQQPGKRYIHKTFPLDRLLAVAPFVPSDASMEHCFLEAFRTFLAKGAKFSMYDASLGFGSQFSMDMDMEETHEHPCITFFRESDASLARDDSRKSFFQELMRSILSKAQDAGWPLDE